MKNLPNILSIFRIVLIPFFVWAFLGLGNIPLACSIFILAGLTDIIDGYIARRFNLITKLGMILDPLADKLLQLTAVAVVATKIPFMWIVFGILLIKEILMGIGTYMLNKRKDVVIPAVWYGKVSSTYLFIVIFVIIACRDYLHENALIALAFSALAFSVFAWIGYMLNFKAALAKGKK
ncbi:MAG: CDP-alcohol phosphatidyltransferase family protein [Oscillospiraceae bacterium]|nr:CDP-alcohol phosphatidyltransferase family protein [Oscillospiraceae bacterium]